jgi:hypothetical protein
MPPGRDSRLLPEGASHETDKPYCAPGIRRGDTCTAIVVLPLPWPRSARPARRAHPLPGRGLRAR